MARYGKEKAYGVAKGIVAKWAEGIAPGGKKGGKPRHTHPDVRAAAQRNIAEWEQKRARAHAQHAKTEARTKKGHALAATMAELAVRNLGSDGPTPLDHVTSIAHEVEEIGWDLSHARVHIDTLGRKADDATREFNAEHADRHLDKALTKCARFFATIRAHYPGEAAALDKLLEARRAVGLARTLEHKATTPHLADTVAGNVAHAKVHLDMFRGAKTDEDRRYNLQHVTGHMDSAAEHLAKLMRHLAANYPGEAKAMDRVSALRAEVGLAGQTVTAPGAQPYSVPSATGLPARQYGLYQKPSATVAPSPPLPPDVQLPTAAEVRALLPLVPPAGDVSLTSTVRKFLEAAAVKLEKDTPIEALTALRSAQTAIYSAHKSELADASPGVFTANIFAQAPPAEQSSSTTSMRESRGRTEAYRSLEQKVGALADRIRRKFFHGVFSGPSQLGRFTEADMSAIDHLAALAGTGYVTGKDVSFPAESDTTQAVPLEQQRGPSPFRLSPKAHAEIAAMSPLDRLKVTRQLEEATRFLSDAHKLQGSHRLLQAKFIAASVGALALESELADWIRSVGMQTNNTKTAPHERKTEAGGKTVGQQDNRQTRPADAGTGPARLTASLRRLPRANR